MKKRNSFILIICLVMIPIYAFMEGGLLPELGDLYGVKMPSFSEVAGKYPDSIEQTAEEERIERYDDISEEQFSAFGVLLSEKECEMEKYNSEGGVFSATIVKSGRTFSFTYDSTKEVATVVYPKGTVDEYVDAAETLYKQAKTEIAGGNYLTARDTLLLIVDYENYEDTSELIKECSYLEATRLLEKNKFDEAISYYSELGSYKDSASMVKKCKYLKGLGLFNSGKYEESIGIFEEIVPYEDTKDLIYQAKVEIRNKNLLTVGAKVTFGRFEQDNNSANGPEDIEWIVIDVQKGKTLLHSTQTLTMMPYNEKKSANWNGSTLQKWLNDSFFKSAFDDNERKEIVKASAGNVFILTFDEMKQYFPNRYGRRFERTPYAYSINSENYPDIWTRTPRPKQPGYAAVLTFSLSGGDETFGGVTHNGCVVPALWIKTTQK